MTVETISDFGRADAVTIDIGWSLQAAAAVMMRHGLAALIVTDHGRPIGLITEHDLVGALAATSSHVARTPIGEVVTGPIPAMQADDSIMHAMALMVEKRLHYLPVFDDSSAIGLVTLRDLIEHLQREAGAEVLSSATSGAPRGSDETDLSVQDRLGASLLSPPIPEVPAIPVLKVT